MKELFLPYNLALLAKEKGFDEKVLAVVYSDGQFVEQLFAKLELSSKEKAYLPAPLYQQIIDWFRNIHGIRFKIEPTLSNRVEIFYYHNGWIFGGVFEDDYKALNKAIEQAFKLI